MEPDEIISESSRLDDLSDARQCKFGSFINIPLAYDNVDQTRFLEIFLERTLEPTCSTCGQNHKPPWVNHRAYRLAEFRLV